LYNNLEAIPVEGAIDLTKKLIALDMDGTFLTTKGTITDENRKAIRDAQAAGHLVMVCSGRPHDSLLSFLKEESLDDLPISGSNGAITVVDGQIIHRVLMDIHSSKVLFNWLDDHKYPFKIYTDRGIFGPSEFFERAEFELTTNPQVANPQFADIGFMKEYASKFPATKVESFAEIPTDIEIFKIYAMTPNMEKKAAFEAFAQEIGGLMITSSFIDNVEVSDALGHKGTGLVAMAEYFNVAMADTIAMGDNFNDLGMLQVAGLAIAMGNAEDEIKKIADVVTLTNDENGVAYAIREHVLK